jgi:excisionase family DNA binding protein
MVTMTQPLTMAQAVEQLGCSISTMQRMIKRGSAPPHYKFEREYRFDLQDLIDWKELKKNQPAAHS